MSLQEALAEWERRWVDCGFVASAELRPGLTPEQVRAGIDFGPAHPDVVTFFGWHDGAHGLFYAYPSGRALYPLQYMLELRKVILKVVDETFDPSLPNASPYPESWLPILYDEHGNTVNVDVNTGEVWRYSTEYPAGDPRDAVQLADTLEGLVRLWVQAFDDTLDRVVFEPSYNHFEYQLDWFPHELRYPGIVM